MTEAHINLEYYLWIFKKVCGNPKYSALLRHLHKTNFYYNIPMDVNRAKDGTSLRYRFGFSNSYRESTILEYLDKTPCSVLEMMAALAIRCEERIMSDPNEGDRTNIWFMNMISSLGLINMVNDNFDQDEIDKVIFNFMDRHYKKNGEGSLFTISDNDTDMRRIEIWYQMCLYLDEIIS